MKIVLTGGAGNITKPLTKILLDEGHDVTVIGRNEENLKPLKEQGAKTAIGSIEDEAFLKKAFEGADVVYTMTPAPLQAGDWVAYGIEQGKKYAAALRTNQVKKVVNLSTFGAHLLRGIGPANLLGQVELALNTLEDSEIIHLRAGYFYTNLVNQIPGIKNSGIIGGNYGSVQNLMLLVHTSDIAEVAAEAITTPNFNGSQPYYIVGDVRSYKEVATVLGNAIDRELTWSEVDDETMRDVFTQSGLPKYLVDIFVEIGQDMANGSLNEHYLSLQDRPSLKKTKLEDYSAEFKAVYNS